MNFRITLIAKIFSLLSIVSYGQGIVVEGQVVDKETQIGIPHVHIILKGSTIGTITNEEGRFILKFTGSKSNKIKVSSIGYETKIIELKDEENLANIVVSLKQEVVELNEILVKGKAETPQQIIEKAFLRIDDNYWLDNHLLTGYFKESENTDNSPIYMAEALVQARIPGRGAERRIEIIRLKGRKKELQEQTFERFKVKKRKGGPYRSLKNSITDPINPVFPSHFKYYKYKIERYTKLNNKNVVVISFTDSKRKPIYGRLIIDLESYAFVRMEGTKVHGMGSLWDNWKWTSHTWIEEYMEDEKGKWLLSSSIYLGSWKAKRTKRKFQYRSFYMTTNYSKDTTFTSPGEKMLRSESAYNAITNKIKSWGDFNYMKLNKAEKKIVKGIKE